MRPLTLLGALAGLLVAGGVLSILVGFRPAPEPVRAMRHGPTERRPTYRADAGPWDRWRCPTAAAVGLLAWLFTSWPVAGLISAMTTVGLPILLSTSRVAARGISRIEAVEEWTRRLSDILVVGVGLEQAIITSLRSVPKPIGGEVAALAARLSARWPTETALRGFADDLADGTGDLVVAALILGHHRRGPGLARVLNAVADSVADEVAMRRRVEADRAKPRTTARAVSLITLGVVAVGALNTTYLAPYGTPLGQLVLAGIASSFVAALAWMRALTLSRSAPRLLASPSARTGSPT